MTLIHGEKLKNHMKKLTVGDLVRMKGMRVWNGEIGIIAKIPKTPHGMWAILLSSGEFIGTAKAETMEVVSESR